MTDSAHPLVKLAARRDRQSSTSATPEQVEIVGELGMLSRALVEHSRRVLVGEAVDWGQIAEQLAITARRCRSQAVSGRWSQLSDDT